MESVDVETMKKATGDTTEDVRNDNGLSETDAWGSSSSGFRNNEIIADMPTGKDDYYYNMKHKRRGMAIIFNHENFNISTLKKRSGTKTDCEQLEICLNSLGYTVDVYHDLSFKKLSAVVQDAVRQDHSDCDSLVIAVLSHGETGILYAKDSPYKPEQLWTPFTADRCCTLAGKPKMFFIQACQGDRLDGGVMLERTETDGVSQCYRIPTHADFLIAYSTVPGFFSWRNTTNGSWFMQALCAELRERSDSTDLLTMLTNVCRRVATDYESNVPGNDTMHRQKQIPCITSMLTRLVRFTPK